MTRGGRGGDDEDAEDEYGGGGRFDDPAPKKRSSSRVVRGSEFERVAILRFEASPPPPPPIELRLRDSPEPDANVGYLHVVVVLVARADRQRRVRRFVPASTRQTAANEACLDLGAVHEIRVHQLAPWLIAEHASPLPVRTVR